MTDTSLTTVTQSNLCEATFNNIHYIIKTYVTDPNSRGTKWVYAEYPSEDITSTSIFPIIIVNDPTVTSESLGLKIINYILNVNIDVCSDKPKECDQVTDDIIEQIEKYYSSLTSKELRAKRIVGCTKDVIKNASSGIKMHIKTLTYRFEYYYTVS